MTIHLSRIQIADFLGVEQVDIAIDDSLFLVAGPNRAGKSSIQHALVALLGGGEAGMPRVGLKREWPMVVRDGKKLAKLSATWDGNDRAMVVKSAGASATLPDWVVHPALLTQSTICRADDKVRRRLLLELTHGPRGLDAEAVRTALVSRGCDPEKVAFVLPLSEAGFDAMEKAATEKAQEARASWKSVTGQVYGSEKAIGWRAVPVVADEVKANALKDLDSLERAVQLASEQYAEHDAKLYEMKRVTQVGYDRHSCPHCGGEFTLYDPELVREYEAAIPRHEEAQGMLKRALENRERDLAAKKDAESIMKKAEEQARATTTKATAHHEDVLAWDHLAKQLAPDQVPADVLLPHLNKLNARMAEYEAICQLGTVTIMGDCIPRLNGRPYQLLSESEQWVTEAMIVLAIAEQSVGFAALDRIDVLDTGKRGQLVRLARHITGSGSMQIVMFGTLKAPPMSISNVWMDGGSVLGVVKATE